MSRETSLVYKYLVERWKWANKCHKRRTSLSHSVYPRLKIPILLTEYQTFLSTLFLTHCWYIKVIYLLDSALILQGDVTPSFRVDSSEEGLIVVIFFSDLPVKRCEGNRA